MADCRDPEKEMASTSAPSTVVPSVGAEEKESLHEHPEDSLSSSNSSRHSEDSINTATSDPLAPLEYALSHQNDLDTPAEQMARPYKTRTATSIGTTGSRLPDFEVDFEPDDPGNPRNWPLWYRCMTIAVMAFATLSVIFYSTSYTSSMPGMMEEFNIDSEPIATLGVTTYLIGLASGSLFLAPLSEIYGRRPVYLGCYLLFMILVIPCAIAKSLTTIIVVRFFGAMMGSCMISNAPGTIADISDEAHLALAFSIWGIGPMNGPVFGPVVGGFLAQYLGWRWTNWFVLIFAGVSWILLFTIKETYAPAILKKRAQLRREETGDERWWSRYDQKLSILNLLKINLTRPFVMSFTEPILWFWNIYIAVVYGMLYLCFVAYPIVFSQIRGWSQGLSGLAFCGIGLGGMIGICGEPIFRRIINSHKKDPETGRVYPEAAVSIICMASMMLPIGQLWFAWTSLPATIHPVWPILAGVPFGCGNALVFIYATNYVAGSYGIYSASALAGNAVVRSLVGGTLPLAGPAMYNALTPQWAGTMLGLLEVLLIPIPIVFYLKGAKIRERSPLIRQMREDVAKSQKRAIRHNARKNKETAVLEDLEQNNTAKQEESNGMTIIKEEKI